MLEGCFLVVPIVVFKFDDKALLREQLGRYLAARVHHDGVYQAAVFHTIKQRVPKRRLTVSATEGAVGVEQQAALYSKKYLDEWNRFQLE